MVAYVPRSKHGNGSLLCPNRASKPRTIARMFLLFTSFFVVPESRYTCSRASSRIPGYPLPITLYPARSTHSPRRKPALFIFARNSPGPFGHTHLLNREYGSFRLGSNQNVSSTYRWRSSPLFFHREMMSSNFLAFSSVIGT